VDPLVPVFTSSVAGALTIIYFIG